MTRAARSWPAWSTRRTRGWRSERKRALAPRALSLGAWREETRGGDGLANGAPSPAAAPRERNSARGPEPGPAALRMIELPSEPHPPEAQQEVVAKTRAAGLTSRGIRGGPEPT